MKNTKLFFLCIIALLFVSQTKLIAQSVSYWDGSDTTVWTNGSGTLGQPYLIQSAANLACLAKRVNEGNNYLGVYFKLTTNVNLGAGNWTPIGISTTNYFSGNFDGDYYTIDSLFINVSATSNSFVGLFGVVQNSNIYKIILKNVQVNQTSASANIYTGALIGATIGGDYIRNCTVQSGKVLSVSATGNKAYAAGIVGCSQFGVKNIKIENCTNAATIYANYALGGIVGMFNVTSTNADTLWLISCSNSGLISGLPTTGNVFTGGVIGWLNLQRNNTQCYIDNCSNTAYVKDSTNGGLYAYTGGLIGYIQNTASANTGINADITNSWNSGKVENINTSLDFSATTWSYVGGITGNLTFYGLATLNYSNVYNTGEIYFLRRSPKTTSAVGGIVGLLSTQYAGGSVNIQQSYNTGNITLASPDTSNYLTYSGGIVGWLYDLLGNYTINKCFNTGNINNDSYYSGGIVGYIGGFYTTGNTINNCFNSGNISSKNTAGGITACYVHKSIGNTITNCISVGTVKATQGGASTIAGTLGDTTSINLASCYYDRQITGLTRGASTFGVGSTCINDTIRYSLQIAQLQLDTFVWVLENKMYPRLKCFQNNNEMILGATPFYFYADVLGNNYNTITKINKSFKIGGKVGTYLHSSNTSIISFINNDSAVVTPLGIDTITITATYGTATRTISVIVQKETFIETETCQGDVYSIYGRNINTDTAGVFTYYGLDSIIQVTVNPTYFIKQQSTICSNDSCMWHGKTLYSAGKYYDTLVSINGCDSIFELTLFVNPIANEVDTITFCSNELPIMYKNVFVNKAGDYTTTFVAANGCDSIIGIHVNVDKAYDTIDVLILSESDLPYTFGSQSLTKAGTYSEVFKTIADCDSTVHLVLIVGTLGGDTVYSDDSKKICKSELPYQYGTILFPIGTETGIYEVGFKTTQNKDSIVFLYLTVVDIPEQPDTIIGPLFVSVLGKYTYSVNPVLGAKEYRWGISNSMFVYEDETNISNNAVLYIAIGGSGIINVAAGNECGFSADQNIQIQSSINVEEIKGDDFVANIYPNPAQDYIDIFMDGNRTANRMEIYDVYGKKVMSQSITDSYLHVDLSTISNGIYFLQMKDNKQIIASCKIIKNK